MYTTIQGDTWDNISYKVYGTEMYAGRLIEANTKHIHTAVFPSGIRLVIPVITEPDAALESLPPWRR